MINVKKRYIYIAIIVIVVIGIAVGTVLLLKTTNNNNNQAQTQVQTNATIKAAGDKLMTESAGATDAASAKALLLKAREKYVEINDKDRIGAVDAMIIMVENSPAPIKSNIVPTTTSK